MKDALVDATGDSVLILQGLIKGLRWTVSDEKPQDGFSEDSS